METIVRCPDCKEKVIVYVDGHDDDEDEREVTCPCGCYFWVHFDIEATVSEVIEHSRTGEERIAEEMADAYIDRKSGVLIPLQ